MKRGGPLKRRSPKMSAIERRAKDLFSMAVLAKGKCVMDDYECSPIVDPHHIVPKQRLKNRPGLTDQGRMELVWDPRNGVPLCRTHHSRVTVGFRRLAPSMVPTEALEFASEYDLGWALEQEVPGFVMPLVYGVPRTEE